MRDSAEFSTTGACAALTWASRSQKHRPEESFVCSLGFLVGVLEIICQLASNLPAGWGTHRAKSKTARTESELSAVTWDCQEHSSGWHTYGYFSKWVFIMQCRCTHKDIAASRKIACLRYSIIHDRYYWNCALCKCVRHNVNYHIFLIK